jgi:hypothetical protein
MGISHSDVPLLDRVPETMDMTKRRFKPFIISKTTVAEINRSSGTNPNNNSSGSRSRVSRRAVPRYHGSQHYNSVSNLRSANRANRMTNSNHGRFSMEPA